MKFKSIFYRVCLVNVGIIAVLFLFLLVNGGVRADEALLTLGIMLLVLSLLNLGVALLGALVLAVTNKRFEVVRAMALFAAIALLCSFTCCSMQPFKL